MIGIIDYGMGNLRSVQKAFESLEHRAEIISSAHEADEVDKLVLPGVGAFADGMANLDERGWSPVLRQWVADDRPMLGICLGMQLLFERSQETIEQVVPAGAASGGGAANPGGPVETGQAGEDTRLLDEWVTGLGLLPGEVVRFRGEAYGPGRLKVPHMGWNALQWRPEVVRSQDSRGGWLLTGLEPGCCVYFVHGYHAQPADRDLVIATTDYGRPVCAVVNRGRLWATQFHPEKSQRVGLTMLINFANMPV